MAENDDWAVRKERTGWRDERISQRHREWGFNCPCVDLDFLVVEYNLGLPVALIEYKHFCAKSPNLDHATYRALRALAHGYHRESDSGEWIHDPLPVMISFYWPDIWAFRVIPLNEVAAREFAHGEIVTEFEYVRRLYKLRRYTLSQNLKEKLCNQMPPAEAAE